ncbi:hypothetical protein PDK26_13275 [Bacillus cereus]|uniref:hypothetical protein n=1 Tax=Bacillus cereus group sp. BfR-BA-01358 TaxID=2920320 RepID=UPI001F5829AB|nr:hypothetical protein [Bacillus cereus group sp. BfR-BA-01358]MDA1612197.1 hypothetical protein [Bacillus cereus]MDA2617911.1 hypothetical protein [Bacillus cereus]
MAKKTIIGFESVASPREGKSWIEKVEEISENVKVEAEFDNHIQDELKTLIKYCEQQDNEELKAFANSIVEKITPLIKIK